MRDLNEPLFLGRSFLAWMNFLLMIFIIICVINSPLSSPNYLLMFIAGMNFSFWLTEPMLKSGYVLARKIIRDLTQFMNEKKIRRKKNGSI